MASQMPLRRLGNTGLKVSALSYGAWVSFGYQIQVAEAKELIGACLKAGVNFFDNAETYSAGEAERIMGAALRELGVPREEYVLSTKIFFGAGSGAATAKGLSRKHIVEGTKASLERLGHEYVDLLYCHRPDPEVPMEETVRAMNWVIEKGWAFYWGTSEWSAEQIEEAWAVAQRLGLIGPAMEQPQYNLFHRKRVEQEYAPLYAKYGLGLTTWSPLASGILTGKYSGGVVPEGTRLTIPRYQFLREKALVEKAHQLQIVDALAPVAEELGCSLAQLSLAWCLHNPHVSTVIMGATKVQQIEDNLGALQVLPKLTGDVVARIEAIVGSAHD